MPEEFAQGFAFTVGALSALGVIYFIWQLIAGLIQGAEDEEREETK